MDAGSKLLILGGVMLILLILIGFLGLLSRNDKDWNLRYEQMKDRHEAERAALQMYGEAVRRYIAKEGSLEDADKAYKHYLITCHPEYAEAFYGVKVHG